MAHLPVNRVRQDESLALVQLSLEAQQLWELVQ